MQLEQRCDRDQHAGGLGWVAPDPLAAKSAQAPFLAEHMPGALGEQAAVAPECRKHLMHAAPGSLCRKSRHHFARGRPGHARQVRGPQRVTMGEAKILAEPATGLRPEADDPLRGVDG